MRDRATSSLTRLSPGREGVQLCDLDASSLRSSTTYVKSTETDKAWLVNFFDGTAYVDVKSQSHHVRAVRGGS